MDGDGPPDIVTACVHQGAATQEVSVHLNGGKGDRWRKVVVCPSAARTTFSSPISTGMVALISSGPIMATHISRRGFG